MTKEQLQKIALSIKEIDACTNSDNVSSQHKAFLDIARKCLIATVLDSGYELEIYTYKVVKIT